jgi:diphthamide synthase (EF-2-diphthine--ammonia ligase)
MHGVHVSLLEAASLSTWYSSGKMELPKAPSMEEYQAIMNKTMTDIQAQGITHSIFGDIFLEDLRQYREEQLNTIGMKAVFPLWKKNTSDLIQEF